MSLESAIARRRSTRAFADAPLALADVAQLLWSAQGVTDQEGHRAAPSAGALYPLELYLVVARVEGVSPGVYRYIPARHALELVRAGDVRSRLMAAALDQTCVGAGAAHLVFSAVYERTTAKYGERGTRYVHMDVGHAGQNVYLQAEALGLGTVAVAAFDDARVREILGLPGNEHPLYIMPVGRR
ncbi:MAG: SagB/ThcOx family dehydrogenase [Armatimonadota bacterium]|nr:SagB/ThcOx family dehydrogenase [Armatimonadota bacterium]